MCVVGGREVEIEAMREEFGQLGCRETASRRRTASRWPQGSSRSRTGVSIRAGLSVSPSTTDPQTRARVNLGVTPSTRRALGGAEIEGLTSVSPRGLGPGIGRPEGLCGGGRWWLGIDGVGILGDSLGSRRRPRTGERACSCCSCRRDAAQFGPAPTRPPAPSPAAWESAADGRQRGARGLLRDVMRMVDGAMF